MLDRLTLRFRIEGDDLPTAGEVRERLGGTVTAVREEGGVYEVEFEPQEVDEADSNWRVLCEVGVHYPEAVLAD